MYCNCPGQKKINCQSWDFTPLHIEKYVHFNPLTMQTAFTHNHHNTDMHMK